MNQIREINKFVILTFSVYLLTQLIFPDRSIAITGCTHLNYCYAYAWYDATPIDYGPKWIYPIYQDPYYLNSGYSNECIWDINPDFDCYFSNEPAYEGVGPKVYVWIADQFGSGYWSIVSWPNYGVFDEGLVEYNEYVQSLGVPKGVTPDVYWPNGPPADCGDACPDDPDKMIPGECGCGVPDIDSDGDGALDCNDNCPNDSNKTEPGVCGCGVDDSSPDCFDPEKNTGPPSSSPQCQ